MVVATAGGQHWISHGCGFQLGGGGDRLKHWRRQELLRTSRKISRRIQAATKSKKWLESIPYLFSEPCDPVPSRANVRAGIHLKADGKFVVAPGSTQTNGRRYYFTSATLKPP